MRGLEAHDGAEIVERRIDVLALRHAGEHLGRAVAHTLRVDLDQRAGVALDRVARMDVERAVVGHDLPVGAARQNAAVEPRAGDGSAEQVHHAAMAERRGPEIEDVGDFAVHVKNRRARDDIHAFSHAPMRLADVVSSGRVEYESGPTKKEPPGANVQGSVERKPIAGEVFLRALAEHGVDYFFANPGTDFPPIVEAFGRARGSNAKMPRPVLVPHENLAVAMAHGAYIITGRPQAVMVHVNVGTGNTLNNLINLSRDRVPLILAAGRTPVTEKGSFGSRSRQIHWGQEMFDQAGMVREIVKWDYELRMPGQIADVVARAHEMTMTTPRGPVYLVLPREPLSAAVDEVAIVPRP